MNDTDDEIKGGGDAVVELQPEMSTSDADDLIKSVSSTALKQREDESLGQPKDNDVKKKKVAAPFPSEESLNTVRLLGEPLVTHGPYTFYNALAYRQRDNVIIKNKQRWKKRQSQVTVDNENVTVVESYDSSSSCCCSGDDVGNDVCSCDDGSPLTSKQSDWSVIQMNHFYAVRPWYSKKNSSTVDRLQQQQHYHQKHSPKLAKSTKAKHPQQHHHQQSVCIGELELLWRDDSLITSTSISSTSSPLKKRSDTKPITEASNGGDEIDTITSSNHGIVAASSDDDDGDGGGNYDGPTALLPRRRLPRRTRQPSAKKLEAAESYAAAVAASAHEHQPTQQVPYRRNQLSATGATSLNPTFASGVSSSLTDTQYKHGNLLCSVRLYVMPDQTAPGRLGGVHGEDEVLEINTWGASGGIDRWQNNVYMNSGGGIGSSYNGGSGGIDDYGYGSGSHSSGTLPSSCSGLVLRAEDFVEWVRGGLMNNDDNDENENTDSEHELMKSKCVDESFNDQKMIKTELPEQENEQQKLSPLTTNIKEEIKTEKLETCHDDEINKIKLESTAGVTNKEVLNFDELKIKEEFSSEISINLDKEKTEQEAVTATNSGEDDEKPIKNKFYNHCYSKSTVDEAIKVESIPLAAAKIHKKHCRRHHCPNSKSLVNGSDTSTTVRKHNHCQHKLKMITNNEDHKHTNNEVCYCYCCKRRRINQSNDKKRNTSGGINKQELVVMSYSRYCRYRAQLQRKHEEQLNERDIAVVTNGDGEKNVVSTHQGEDNINTTRVLFCRDTYDYPAELLLEPFNTQQCQQQNTSSVLVNHLAPKLKGWPAYPSSWMSFRWNRVRRRLRHLERGSGSNDDNRRCRRRRKLKKKCRSQNEASDAMGVMNYSSSSEDDDSDNSDSDDASSATNDATTNTTTTASTSDSDGAIPPPSVVIAKTVNKNHSSTIPKANGGIHHNNKKNHSLMASNMITINGVTSISATAINKRPAITIQQSSQQNPMKRRRVVYTQGPSQHQNQLQQRIVYQQQQQNLISRQTQQQQQQQQQQYRSRQSDQLNQHMLVVQQHQQRLHSFNQRLSTSSQLQAPSARIIHHHLPPSVSIMPVIMSNSNMVTQQQRFKQNRQKQHISVGVQRQNNNNDRQQTLAPVIIEYDKTQERGSNDNGRYNKSTVTYHRRVERHDFKGDQNQQREDDRQRRWLVDALRLGGLEVTAVPLNVDTGRGNNNSCGDGKNIVSTVTATLQQQQRRRQRGISFESLSSTNKHIHNGDVGKNEQSLGSGTDDNSDFNSEIMTITPDVLSMLDKSEHKHQLVQKTLHHNRTSLDRASTSMILAGTAQPHQQRRRSINIQSNSNNSSSQQPHSTKTAVAAAALHDKIYRAIDSLKQQQKQQNLNTSTSVNNRGNNVIVMSGTNYHQSNSDNNYRQQQRRLKNDGVADGIRQQQQTIVTPALLDLTVKSLTVPNTTTNIKQQKTLTLSPTINPQQQQQRKIISPFHSTTTSDAANLEISIVPVTAATSVNSTRFLSQKQHQQKHGSSTASYKNSTGGSEVTSSLSLMTVRQQLQQRNVVSTVTSSTASVSFLDILCGGKNRHQRNVTATSTSTTTITTSQEQPQQQPILFSSVSSAVAPALNKQQNIKRKPQ